MSDQSTTRAAAYADIHGAGGEPLGGKQACRRTFLKASGGLIAGAAAQLSPAGAAAQGAVAAEHGSRDIIKRDPQASSLVASIAEFVPGAGVAFGWYVGRPSSCLGRDRGGCPTPPAGSRANISWTPSAAVSRPRGWGRADRLPHT